MKKYFYLATIVGICFFWCPGFSYGQSIWENPITNANPSSSNPFVLGQTFDPNITVSGIGRGPSVLANAAVDRYSASNWNPITTDPGDYFSWTLTPNSGFEINFISLVFKAQVSGIGPTSFALRSSVDGFFGDIANPVIPNSGLEEGPYTINLSIPLLQNITSPITFRMYGCCGGIAAGTFSINDFIFNATVDSICFPPALSNSLTNVSCNGGANGSIDLIPVGGTSPFTYAWTGPGGFNATTEDISGLVAGTYDVTATSFLGCTATTSINITEPATALTANISSSTNVSCNGGNNGSATVLASGGTLGYTYLWAPSGGSAATASGLIIGTYTVTVTDLNGCTVTASTTITEPPTLNVSTTHTDLLCNGANTGSIDLTVTGGTTSYTYLWSNSAITQDISSLVANTYTVTVTDAHGCTATTSVAVTEPTALNLTTTNTNISCNGASDGSIDLTVTGGNPTYTYLWNNSAITQDISSLGVGTYSVTVTDLSGCTSTTSTSITAPAILTPTAAVTNISCNGMSDGIIDIGVSGGTPSFTYAWSNSAITQDISSLGVGTYSVTVTDAHGCTATTSASITEPAVLNLSTTHTNVNCGGSSTGSIDLTVTGGTLSYSYAWSNSANTQDVSGLSANTYTVTVTDAHGCTATTSVSITQPPAIILTSTHTNVTTCYGGNNGSIDLTVAGGLPSYTYLWSNNATTQDVSSLSGGNYNVTVTDASGCTANTLVNISQPPSINLSSTHINPGCSGGINNGSINLTATGGNPGYTFLWSNSAITEDISGLSNGTYTVTVTDASGCTNTTTVVLTSAANLNLSASWTNASCNGGNTGTIDLTVNTGTPTYTYLWSNGATTQDVSSLAAGTYTVTVNDAGGCSGTHTQLISDAGLINSYISVYSCGFYVSPSGLYTWTTSGVYPDTLTATNGCDSLIGIDLTIVGPDVNVTPFGHTFTAWLPGASYQWLDCDNAFGVIPGATSQIYISPVNGNFAVKVTSNGCSDTSICYTTTNLSMDEDGFNGTVHLYPNPNNGIFNVLVEGLVSGDVTADITDIAGKQVYNQVIGNIEGNINIPFELTDLRMGVYLFRLNANGSSKLIRFIKTE